MKPEAFKIDKSCRNTANLPKPGGFAIRYKCPMCGQVFSQFIGEKELNYCYNCGESIFWGGCISHINSQMSEAIRDVRATHGDKIGDLSEILNKQDIDVPRLRGLRLMKNESPVSEQELSEMLHRQTLDIVQDIVEQNSLNCWSSWKAFTRKDILKFDYTKAVPEVVDFRWDKIHGKRRKWIKFEVKKAKKAIYNQYRLFNSFAGRPDVLYVHARIGGANWLYYQGFLLKKNNYFLAKVDDYYDSTYCDLYFTIDESLLGPRNKAN